jgi:hypothetical protein
LRGADVIDIRVLAFHRHADVIERDRQLIAYNIRALPDAGVSGGREVISIDLDPGIRRE